VQRFRKWFAATMRGFLRRDNTEEATSLTRSVLLTIAILVIALATPVVANSEGSKGYGGACSPNINGATKTVSGTSGDITITAAASLAASTDTTQTGGNGGGGSQAVAATAGPAENHGAATGTSLANSGDQINGITQNGQCASNGVNVGGNNTGVVNNGNGNRVVNNSGEVFGVLIQNLGAKGGGKGAGATTIINAVGNTGNVSGQANVGGGKKGGSSPNQNSNQTFISQ
jgi:hypothetical protein